MADRPFDPGPVAEPFAGLCRRYPGPDVYPPEDFRVEWGPIFHRGRLDGTARVLVVGQDPGQHEAIARRILVGEAGQRVQGFLAKLGITRSYVMVNAYLYSVYGQRGGERHARNAAISRHRNRWLDAIAGTGALEAIVTFGHLAEDAVRRWRRTERGRAVAATFTPLTHPTMPEASSRGDREKLALAMQRMLAQWNAALDELDAGLGPRDEPARGERYGDALTPADRQPIPARDLPPGSPLWWSGADAWAARRGDTPAKKRATIEVTVPRSARTWT